LISEKPYLGIDRRPRQLAALNLARGFLQRPDAQLQRLVSGHSLSANRREIGASIWSITATGIFAVSPRTAGPAEQVSEDDPIGSARRRTSAPPFGREEKLPDRAAHAL